MTAESEKVVANRMRRVAKRRGYLLVKSARRDKYAWDYGKWALYLGHHRVLYNVSLDDVVRYFERAE